MMRVRNTILIFTALLVLGTLAANAGASVPELGRCVRQMTKTNVWKTGTCTTESVNDSTGRYEWLPGPGTANRFTGTGSSVVFEEARRLKLDCTGARTEGTFTSAHSVSVSLLTFAGCTDPQLNNTTCETRGHEPGSIANEPLVGGFGYINREKLVVGVDLSPAAGASATFTSFGCDDEAAKVAATGSVISSSKPIDKMTSTFTVTLKQRHGVQIPSAFEGADPDTLEAEVNEGPVFIEPAGLETELTDQAEEPIEVKAKCLTATLVPCAE